MLPALRCMTTLIVTHIGDKALKVKAETCRWNRYAVICEHDSGEDIVKTLSAMPLGGLMNYEVYPMADYDVAMKAHIEATKAAEKMMPRPPG